MVANEIRKEDSIKPVPRLYANLSTLWDSMQPDDPLKRLIRAMEILIVHYGFGTPQVIDLLQLENWVLLIWSTFALVYEIKLMIRENLQFLRVEEFT